MIVVCGGIWAIFSGSPLEYISFYSSIQDVFLLSTGTFSKFLAHVHNRHLSKFCARISSVKSSNQGPIAGVFFCRRCGDADTPFSDTTDVYRIDPSQERAVRDRGIGIGGPPHRHGFLVLLLAACGVTGRFAAPICPHRQSVGFEVGIEVPVERFHFGFAQWRLYSHPGTAKNLEGRGVGEEPNDHYVGVMISWTIISFWTGVAAGWSR